MYYCNTLPLPGASESRADRWRNKAALDGLPNYNALLREDNIRWQTIAVMGLCQVLYRMGARQG